MIYRKVAEKITESINEAISELKWYIDELMTDEYRDEIFILESRYKDLIRKSRLGIISTENLNIQENKIRFDILNVSKDIDKLIVKAETKPNGFDNSLVKAENTIFKELIGKFAFWEFLSYEKSLGFIAYEYVDYREYGTEIKIQTLILYGHNKGEMRRGVFNIAFDLKKVIAMEVKSMDSMPNDKLGFSIERHPSKLSVDCVKIYSKDKVIKEEMIDMFSYEKSVSMKNELEIIILNDKPLLEKLYVYLKDKWVNI